MLLERRLFFMHCSLCLFRILSLDEILELLFYAKLSFGSKKKWLLEALDSNDCEQEFAWADSQDWSFGRGGRLNRFDCNALS